jgi:hypothetical protein
MHFHLFPYLELKGDKFEILSKIIASLPRHKFRCTLWQISGELDEEFISHHLALYVLRGCFLWVFFQKHLVRSCWTAGRINLNLPKAGQCRRWSGSLCRVVKARVGWKCLSARTMKAAHPYVYWQGAFELSSFQFLVVWFKLPQTGASTWSSCTYVLQCGNRIHISLIFLGGFSMPCWTS